MLRERKWSQKLRIVLFKSRDGPVMFGASSRAITASVNALEHDGRYAPTGGSGEDGCAICLGTPKYPHLQEGNRPTALHCTPAPHCTLAPHLFTWVYYVPTGWWCSRPRNYVHPLCTGTRRFRSNRDYHWHGCPCSRYFGSPLRHRSSLRASPLSNPPQNIAPCHRLPLYGMLLLPSDNGGEREMRK
jgi:hypothetical protein